MTSVSVAYPIPSTPQALSPALLQSQEAGTIISILQMSKLRRRKITVLCKITELGRGRARI